MTVRISRRRRALRTAVFAAAVGALLVAGQPAHSVQAAITPNGASQPVQAVPGSEFDEALRRARALRPAASLPSRSPVKLPNPVVVPGTGRTVQPFADIGTLNPIVTHAPPGTDVTAGLSLVPAPTKAGDARTQDPENPSLGGCNFRIDKSVSNHDDDLGEPHGPVRIADITYAGKVTCNFFLASIAAVIGVFDRTPRFNGEVIGVGEEVRTIDVKEVTSRGLLSLFDEWDDHGRQVEVGIEVFLAAPPGLNWGTCNPLTNGLRYLRCDGMGTNVAHITVGTGPFGTGLKPPVAQYVALGDSYASGNAARPYEPLPIVCYRSLHAFHHLITGFGTAEGLTIQKPRVRSCSGARIDDMYGTQSLTEGPQLWALSPYTTRLVTISIGGNDLGFGEELTRCLNVFVHCTDPIVDPLKVAGVQARLGLLYQHILENIRPDATLVVLSYPATMPRRGEPTCGVVSLYTEAELDAIDAAWRTGREVVRRAAISVGDPRIKFVDMYDAFAGHNMCSPRPYATHTNTIDTTEWFHPNHGGHEQYALRIRQAIQ